VRSLQGRRSSQRTQRQIDEGWMDVQGNAFDSRGIGLRRSVQGLRCMYPFHVTRAKANDCICTRLSYRMPTIVTTCPFNGPNATLCNTKSYYEETSARPIPATNGAWFPTAIPAILLPAHSTPTKSRTTSQSPTFISPASAYASDSSSK